MNFIKNFIIVLILSLALLQSTETKTTIRPQVEISQTKDNIFFIGFSGKALPKTAQLYSLSKKGELKELQQFNYKLKEEDTNYFVSGHKGDITGEGQDDFILIATNPNSGTKIHSFEISNNLTFNRLHLPHTVNTEITESQPISSKLAKIYKDKDKEIVISFGSPDRKAIVLDYVGEIKQTETIGKSFLSNLAGPIIMRTADINNDGLDDIYLMNNGEKTIETIYFSPEREKKQKTLKFQQQIKDIYLSSEEDGKNGKIILLKNGSIFFEEWNKTTTTEIKNPQKIILINNSILSIINKQGEIYHYQINKEKETLSFIKKIQPNFTNNKITNIFYLILSDKENIILSHDNSSELILQPLYNNTKPNKKEANNQKLKKQKEQRAEKTTNKEEKTTNKEEKTTNKEEKITEKKQQPTNQTITLNADTVFVNVGEITTIKINLNKNYNFIDLKSQQRPDNANFKVEDLSFNWKPTEKDAGYHALNYIITYNTNLGITQKKQGNQIVIENKTKEVEEQKNHIIFVNDKPNIKTDSTTYNIQANHQIAIPLKTRDKNKTQKLSLKYAPTKKETKIIKKTFFWTPKNKDYGKNPITFYVTDGISKDSTTAIINVDTLKKKIINEKEFIWTVNQEFIHQIPKKEKTLKYKKIQTPHNLRVSKSGEIHWIPISTQIGTNTINIEIVEEKQSYIYALKIFVNSPPIISYTPNKTEHINKDETFRFQFQSFDENQNQNHFWTLEQKPDSMILNQQAEIIFIPKKLDYNDYVVSVNDTIDTAKFKGSIYVNGPPIIEKIPSKHINLGETYQQTITTKDPNKHSPNSREEKNKTPVTLQKAPKTFILKNEELRWTPTKEDVGEHEIIIQITDTIDTTTTAFYLYVNDMPKITSADSISVQLGDTLKYFLTAKDLNTQTTLTYSINSNLKNMMLNAQTGEIVWVPQKEDIGTQIIKAGVTDGFASNKEGKKIKILVYDKPKFIGSPPTEAYANIEYKHQIQAEDGEGKNIPQEDIFIQLTNTTFPDLILDTTNNILSTTPKPEQVGDYVFTLLLKDKNNHTTTKQHNISVLISPCETLSPTEPPTETKIKEKEPQKNKKTETRKEKREKKRKERKERKNKKIETKIKQDTIFVEIYDTLQFIDTLYTTPKIIKKIQKPKPKTTKTTKDKEKENNPIVITKKINIEIRDTLRLSTNKLEKEKKEGIKTPTKNIFSEAEWGTESIKKEQKTKTDSTVHEYNKLWAIKKKEN